MDEAGEDTRREGDDGALVAAYSLRPRVFRFFLRRYTAYNPTDEPDRRGRPDATNLSLHLTLGRVASGCGPDS
jgi:hypothetical protein